MITTQDQAKEYVRLLGLPRPFTELWDDQIPFELSFNWQRPDRYFSFQDELLERYPRLATCVPLWESNRDHVYAFDTATKEFIRCDYYEEPYLEVVASSYQQFAAAYLVDCVYAGIDDLDAIADLLEFKHLDRLRIWAAMDDDTDAGEAKRKFVESIPPGR